MKGVPLLPPLTLLLLSVLLAGPPADAETGADLKQAEGLYQAGRYAEAETAYQQLAIDNAGTEVGLAGESGLALLYAQTGKDSLFAESRARLVADYGTRPEFRRAMCTIGDNLRWRGLNPQAARQVYSLAAAGELYPDMIWARMGLAISCIRLKDYEAAGPVVESLWADFPKDERLGQALCHIGDAYRDRRRHADARRLYQYVVDKLPKDEYALWSQAGLAISAIDAREEPAARAAIEKLRANHAKRPDFAAAAAAVADNYRWRSAHAQACALYRLATRANPNHAQGLWFQMGLAISSIATGDPNTGQACLTRLRERYGADPGLPQALYEIAYAFSNAKQYDQAVGLFNEVVVSWADSDYAPFSRVGLGLVQVRQGHDEAGEVIYRRILADYKDHPKLAAIIRLMAEGYRERAKTVELEEIKLAGGTSAYAIRVAAVGRPEAVKDYHRRAIEKWEIIIKQLPASSDTSPAAYTFAAQSYDRLGNFQKALECFSLVAERYPEYQHADYALLMVSRMFKKLHKQERMTQAEALPMILGASRDLLVRYPESEYAPVARETVERMSATASRKEAPDEP